MPTFAEDLAAGRIHARGRDGPQTRSAVTRRLTRRRRARARPPIETPDYAAMMRRLLVAYGRRAGDADVEDLAEMLRLRAVFEDAVQMAVTLHRRRHGTTWAEIGRAAGITRQSAHKRWGRAA